MKRLTATFIRSLVIFATAQLVGCDAPIEDGADEIELRDGALPIAGIPSDDPIKVTFSIPLQPVGKFKPKEDYVLHGPTDLGYVWTLDPTGDPDAIMVDPNGVSPYSENLPLVPEAVCADFLEEYPFLVPVLDSPNSCSQVEQGCCDRVCYLWGGEAIEDDGKNVIVAVDDDTFLQTEMVEGTYVETDRLPWTMGATNGGYSPRVTPCGCLCAREE